MGASLTLACTLAAACGTYKDFDTRPTNFVYTQYVVGGTTFPLMVSKYDSLVNVTILQNGGMAVGSCITNTTGACTANVTAPIVDVSGIDSVAVFSWTASGRSGANVNYTSNNVNLAVVPPTPSQPTLTANASQYQATVSQYSAENMGTSNITACVLAYAPSSTWYEAEDLPLQWNYTTDNIWVPDSVSTRQRVWYNLAPSTVLAGSFASLLTADDAGLPFDYHFACYNNIGRSFKAPLYSYVGVGGAPSRPVMDAAGVSMTSLTGAMLSSTLLGEVGTYYALEDFPGSTTYTLANCTITLPQYPGLIGLWNAPLTNHALNPITISGVDFSQTPNIELQAQCANRVGVSKPAVATLYAATMVWLACEPSYLCPVVTMFNQDGTNATQRVMVTSSNLVASLSSVGPYPDVLMDYWYGSANIDTLYPISDCTTDNTTTRCSGPCMQCAQFPAGDTITLFAGDDNEDYNIASLSVITIAPIPSQPTLTPVFDAVQSQLLVGISQYSIEYGSQIDGCCLQWGNGAGAPSSSFTYADILNNVDELTQLCWDSPLQGSTIVVNYSDIAAVEATNDNSIAGQAINYHAMCWSADGMSYPASIYQLTLKATVPNALSVIYADLEESSLAVTVRLPDSTGLLGFAYDRSLTFDSCTLLVGPRGFDPSITTPIASLTVNTSDTPQPVRRLLSVLSDSTDSSNLTPNGLVRFSIDQDFTSYMQITVLAYCNNSVGGGSYTDFNLTAPLSLSYDCNANPAYCNIVSYFGRDSLASNTKMILTTGAAINLYAKGVGTDLTFNFLSNVAAAGSCVSNASAACFDISNPVTVTTVDTTQTFSVTEPSSGQWAQIQFWVQDAIPSQPQLVVHLNNSQPSIDLIASLYSSEYTTDVNSSLSLTGCTLGWGFSSSNYEGNDLILGSGGLAGVNTTTTFAITPAQGSVTTVNFADLLQGAVYLNVSVDFHFVCFNAIGASAKASVYNLVVIGARPQPLANLAVLVDSWNHMRLRFDTPDALNNVRPLGTYQDQYFESVTVVIGYAGFRFPSEANYTLTYSVNPQNGNPFSPHVYGESLDVYGLDFTWIEDYDVYVFINNTQGASDAVTYSFQYFSDHGNAQLSLEPHCTSADGGDDVCNSIYMYTRASAVNVPYYYTVVQNQSVSFIVYGVIHSTVTVQQMVNATTNVTLGSGMVTGDGFYHTNGSLITPSNVGTLLNYTVTSTMPDDYNSSFAKVSLVTVAPVPLQPGFYWRTEYTKEGSRVTFSLSASSAPISEADTYGCVLVWNATSTFYEGDDLPQFVDPDFAQFSNWANSAAFVDFEYFAVYANTLMSDNAALVPQDFHWVCYNRFGRSAKTSMYGLQIMPAVPAPPANVTAVSSGNDYSTVNVTFTTGAFTGNVGLSQSTSLDSCYVDIGPAGWDWLDNWDNEVWRSVQFGGEEDSSVNTGATFSVSITGLDLVDNPAYDVYVSCYNWDNLFAYTKVSSEWDNPYAPYGPLRAVVTAAEGLVQKVTGLDGNIIQTVHAGARLNFTLSFTNFVTLQLTDISNNSTVISECTTQLDGRCSVALQATVNASVGHVQLYSIEGGNTTRIIVSFLVAPPIPSQPVIAYNISADNSQMVLSFTASQYSSEYSSALVGCLVSWAPATNATAMNASSGINIPISYPSTVDYTTVFPIPTPAQGSKITVNASSLGVAAGAGYIVLMVCYNQNGASFPTALLPTILVAAAPSAVVASTVNATIVDDNRDSGKYLSVRFTTSSLTNDVGIIGGPNYRILTSCSVQLNGSTAMTTIQSISTNTVQQVYIPSGRGIDFGVAPGTTIAIDIAITCANRYTSSSAAHVIYRYRAPVARPLAVNASAIIARMGTVNNHQALVVNFTTPPMTNDGNAAFDRCTVSISLVNDSHVARQTVDNSLAPNSTVSVSFQQGSNGIDFNAASGVIVNISVTCENDLGASVATSAMFSYRAPPFSSSSSSSTGASPSSSIASDLSSSSAAAYVSSSSSSASAQSSSSVIVNNKRSSSSSTGAPNDGTSKLSSSSSSAVIYVAPVGQDIPQGTMSVSMTVSLPDNATITVTFTLSLRSDFAVNLALFMGVPAGQLLPFIQVTIGTSQPSARRLLLSSVPVNFVILGNISTVANSSSGGSSAPVNFTASSAASFIANRVSAGTFNTTSTTALTGATVPQQTVTVMTVVAPPQSSSSSSSTGDASSSPSFESNSSSTGVASSVDDSSSSSLSGGAIAGIVVGSVAGVALIIGVVAFIVAAGVRKSCLGRDLRAVADANTAVHVSPKTFKYGQGTHAHGGEGMEMAVQPGSPAGEAESQV